MADVFIRVVELPYFVKGQVLLDDNGDYNVYINGRYSERIQAETLQHELKHISECDMYSARPVTEIEGLQYG